MQAPDHHYIVSFPLLPCSRYISMTISMWPITISSQSFLQDEIDKSLREVNELLGVKAKTNGIVPEFYTFLF